MKVSDVVVVELVYAEKDRQFCEQLELPAGTTLAEALAHSSIEKHFPAVDFKSLKKGVWGAIKPDSHVLVSGDRLEIYRPLVIDPREARRRRVLRKKENEKKR